jgi:alpha-galactosidase
MVEDYGAEYIKFDYNEDCGVGTDYLALCAGEGLELCAQAYLDWVQEMIARFPQVVFEGCSSGGMRMDYKTLSVFSLVSTSDQTNYLKYPYIAGNILSAVIPEQAAVWSYPVGCAAPGAPMTHDEAWVAENITNDRIAMNMINSFLGRMHLASHLELMNEEQLSIVGEGIAYYDTLTEAKKSALPYLPEGFTHFGAERVVAGFKTEDKIYLAVWCLGGEKSINIPIDEKIKEVKIAYPSKPSATCKKTDKGILVEFSATQAAVFLEMNY